MAFTYQNQVFLKGQIGNDLKVGKATTGKKYMSFSLIVNSSQRDISDDVTKSVEYIRIFIFNNNKKKMVDKLEEMGLKKNMFVSIVGRLQTARTEFKGNPIIQLSVQVIDLSIIQTKSINKND